MSKRIVLSEKNKFRLGKNVHYNALIGEKYEITKPQDGDAEWKFREYNELQKHKFWTIRDRNGDLVSLCLHDEDARLRDTLIHSNWGSGGMWLVIGLFMLIALLLIF